MQGLFNSKRRSGVNETFLACLPHFAVVGVAIVLSVARDAYCPRVDSDSPRKIALMPAR